MQAQDKEDLQRKFDEFFGHMVSEWNPCFSEDGQCRYRWDEELGIPEPELALDMSSEGKAQRCVNGQSPDRVNLRSVLDHVFQCAQPDLTTVDLQPVRRLVSALVQTVARHTKHGMQAPKLGVHSCARIHVGEHNWGW